MEKKKEEEDEIVDFEFEDVEERKYLTFQTTRMIEHKHPGDREKYLKMALIELIIHAAFLIVIIYIADNSNYKLVYDITHSVSQLFVHSPISKDKPGIMFSNLTSYDDAWEYLRNGLMNGLYWELEYGGRNLTDEEIGYILYRNKLMHSAVIRQIKGIDKPCTDNPGSRCYDPYSSHTTKKEVLPGTYGVSFNNSDMLGFKSYTGRIGTYLPEGYQIPLPPTKREALILLDSLQSNDWIDRATRALFIEFILFNKQLNNHCFLTLAMEFPIMGGVFTSYDLGVVKIIRFQTNLEFVDVIVEFLFNCFILFYCFVAMVEMASFKLSYFTYFASLSDLSVVIISLCCTGIGLYSTFATKRSKPEYLPPGMTLLLGKLLHWSDSAMSIVFCLSFIKLFRYLNFNSTLWSLSKTVYLCANELTGLLFLCGVIYVAFALTGVCLFGYDFEEFSSISTSIASMIRILLGDMDFQPFSSNSLNVTGSFFSIFFEAIIFFVFMAGFLAVILSAYNDVSLLHQKQKFEMQMLEYSYRKLAQLFRKKYNEPPLISVQDWIKTMMDLGHPADAAEIVVSKYVSQGITLDSFLTYPQQDELTYELEYYLKSSYMEEKLTSLQVGFSRLKNIFEFKSSPFITSNNPSRGLTVASRMISANVVFKSAFIHQHLFPSWPAIKDSFNQILFTRENLLVSHDKLIGRIDETFRTFRREPSVKLYS